jgi:hypothetical protein
LPRLENSGVWDMLALMAKGTEQGKDGIFTMCQKKLICRNKLADYKLNFKEKMYG